jgi:hypothetical protein
MDDVLIGGIEKREIVIVEYDPRWPEKFQKHAEILSGALIVHAVSCAHPNLKLRRVLKRRGFEVRTLDGDAQVYYRLIDLTVR